MQDDRYLVELINRRFDDLVSRTERFEETMSARISKHEEDDKERFNSVTKDMEPLKNMKAQLGLLLSGALVLIQLVTEYLKNYLAK